MTRGLRAGAVVVLAAVSLAAACAPGGDTGTALLPTPLPDLTALAPSVQTQLRDAHARLGALARRPANDAARGAAFGELGRLLLAAQFPDAPEACFRNAETLAPRDPRWPCDGRGSLGRNIGSDTPPEPSRAPQERLRS